MKPDIHQRRGKMDPKTNIYVLLKNLEAFINSVPINPELPNCKDWEKTRTEMKKALKNTNEILAKQGFPERLDRCRKVLEKTVFPERVLTCRKVLVNTALVQLELDRKKS
jgi:hypothetical protein